MFAPAVIHPDVINVFNLTDISDIGWVQWATVFYL